jgi:pimeloyl-ACP methyl ester carboxylesterase
VRDPQSVGGRGDIRVRYDEFAGLHTRVIELDGSGSPVILLHGFSDSADTWRPVIGHLARRGHRAVAVDLPGFGHADRLPRDSGLLEPLDTFLDAVVQSYDDGQGCVVVGNSLGATLSLRAAERDLPLVGAVAISPAGLDMTPQAWSVDRIMQARLTRLAFRLPISARTIERAATFAYGRYAGRGVDTSAARSYGTNFAGGLRDLRRYGAMAGLLANEVRNGPYHFDRVRAPVLLLWGDRDPFCPVRGARLILDAVADSRLVVLDGCGHCAQLEAPVTIANEVVALARRGREG